MNLRRLEYFLAVVDAGTVTAAAAQLHIAQPALSRQVKTLEREVKMALFTSSGNRLVLTQAGRAFVPLARRLLAESRSIEDAAAALRTGRVPSLRVAATAASIRTFLAPFVATTTADDPRLLVAEASHFDIHERLTEGADLIVSPAERQPGLRVTELGAADLRAYVHRDHPWARAGRTEVALDEVAAQRLVLPSHASVSRFILDHALSGEGAQLQRFDECDDGLTIMALAASGHAVGITSERGAFDVHALTLRSSASSEPDGALRIPLHAAWSPNHYAGGVIEDLTLRLRDFLGNLIGGQASERSPHGAVGPPAARAAGAPGGTGTNHLMP